MQDRRFVFLIRAIIPRAADDGASGKVRLPFSAGYQEFLFRFP